MSGAGRVSWSPQHRLLLFSYTQSQPWIQEMHVEGHLEPREKHRTARVEVIKETVFLKTLSRAVSSLQNGGVASLRPGTTEHVS